MVEKTWNLLPTNLTYCPTRKKNWKRKDFYGIIVHDKHKIGTILDYYSLYIVKVNFLLCSDFLSAVFYCQIYLWLAQ